MGGSIAKGLAKGDDQIYVTAKTNKTLDALKAEVPNLNVGTDNIEAIKGADLIILAVKPWILPLIADEIKNALTEKQIIISVIAGIGFEDLNKMFCVESDLCDRIMFRVIPTLQYL